MTPDAVALLWWLHGVLAPTVDVACDVPRLGAMRATHPKRRIGE